MSSKLSVRLSLESLDGRIVPDATPTMGTPDPLTTPLTVTLPALPDPGTQTPVNVSANALPAAVRPRARKFWRTCSGFVTYSP